MYILFVLALTLGVSHAQDQVPEHCFKYGYAAQVKAQAVSTAVVNLEQDQVECTFRIQIYHGQSQIDPNCPLDLQEAEMVTYVDPACSIRESDQLYMMTEKFFNMRDLGSPGLFYWIDFGGYQSHLVFPNRK